MTISTAATMAGDEMLIGDRPYDDSECHWPNKNTGRYSGRPRAHLGLFRGRKRDVGDVQLARADEHVPARPAKACER
jgi:hypothetical protein